MSSRRLLPALSLVLLGASYALPGANTTPIGPVGLVENGYHRVARDSQGFWYYVWDEYSTSSRVYLSYTTTSTPSGSGDWGLVTLVALDGTGVIAAPPANNLNGRAPSIGMGPSDVLHVIWDQASAQRWIYWTKCPALSSLTSSASWATPVLVHDAGAGKFDYQSGFVLDRAGVPYVLYLSNTTGAAYDLAYTKYDTASGTFLPGRIVVSGGGNGWADLGIDLEDNLYMAYSGTETSAPVRISQLCSTNASTTSPAGSVWRNLAQTTTDPDILSTNGSSGGPLVLLDYTGTVHVVWDDNTTSHVWAADGVLGQGWRNQAVRDGVACKPPRGMTAFSNGEAHLFSIRKAASAGSNDIYVTRYTSQGWEGTVRLLALDVSQSQGLWTERRAPEGRLDSLPFALDAAADRTLTTYDERLLGAAPVYEPVPPPGGGACFLATSRRR